ncbi:hypothetical protein BH10PSE17_BH10PSE17_04630 [soil metagenome]
MIGSAPIRPAPPWFIVDAVGEVSSSEIEFIASLDYDVEATRHEAELRSVLFEQGGRFTKDQHWFPYEVIELGANVLVEGREREFTICTLLLVEAVKHGSDKSTDLDTKFGAMHGVYECLPATLRDAILIAYGKARP